MLQKVLVIFNPGAGLTSRQNTEQTIKKTLSQAGYGLVWLYLNQNFEQHLDDCPWNELSLVVAVGGDGTVRVAARTILENNLSCPLGIIPFGSANVIAVSLGLPLDLKKALNLIIEGKDFRAIDVGLINQKIPFLVGFSAGYVSQIVTGTDVKIKNRLGFLGYVVNFLFSKIKIKKIKFKIETAKKTFWVKGNSLIIFNALNYFGLKTKKPINFADGVLNLFILTNKTFWSLFEAGFYLLRYHKPPRHVFTLDGDNFKLTFKKTEDSCQVDGDYIALPRQLEISLQPLALRIISKNER